MASLDLETNRVIFYKFDETALANGLKLSLQMEQHCPEVKAAAVSATDSLKKLLEHVKKARAPKS